MSKGSILMIGNYLSSPRHNRNIWHSLSERLAASGWNIITTSTKENKLVRLVDMAITVINKRKHYQIAQIDVFSGYAFIFAEICTRLLHLYNKPVILTLHGGRLPEFASLNVIRVQRLLQSADYVTTPSQYLQNNLGMYRSDIRIIPNPVEPSVSIYRNRNKLKPKLVWVRAFHKTYNPMMAVNMLCELSKDFPDVKLTMIGPDKGDGSLERLLQAAKDCNVEDHLLVIPAIPHSEVPVYLDQNDIFINTSNYDTAPRSIIEAMANGLCIVSTNVGGIPWLIKDTTQAILVPPNSPQEMVEAVKRLLSEPELASQISRNAHNASKKYTWDRILPLWESLFMEVIAGISE